MRKLLAGKIGKARSNEKTNKKTPLLRFTELLKSSCLEIFPEQAFVLLDNSDPILPQKCGEREKIMFVHLIPKRTN